MDEILSEAENLFSLNLYLLFIHVILWQHKKVQTSNEKHFTKLTSTAIEKFLCFYSFERLSNPPSPEDILEGPRKSGKEIGSWKKNTYVPEKIWLYKFDMQFQKDFGLTIKSKGRL